MTRARGETVELNTFSIVGRCRRTGEFGVAVATARPAVGAVVPWASLDGAIATQARSNTELGRDGLGLLETGMPIADALARLLADDPDRERRQLHGLDRQGSFAHTGADCVPWCGHRLGPDFTVAGNMLVGPEVLEAMAAAFSEHPGRDLGHRLLRALEAGQAAGGDMRGKQSAALLVASTDPRPHHNLRVDDHRDPVAELARLTQLVAPLQQILEKDYGAEGVRRYRRPKL